MIYIATLIVNFDDVANLRKKAQIAYLKGNEAFTKELNKYTDFKDIFSLKLAAELSKHTKMNYYAIKLVDNWQPLYNPIYRLEPVEQEILKAYIKNNQANSFISPFKSLAKVLIFFDKESDASLRLCMNYQGFNHLTIKNRYPLSLVGELLNPLSWAHHFT